MDKQDVIEAYNTAMIWKNLYRKYEGRKLLQEMIDSENTPSKFLVMCIIMGLDSVSFIKDISSSEYMPDTGWFICLDGSSSASLSFLYECTDSYEEYSDFFSESGIGGSDDLVEAVKEYGVTLSEEEGVDIFKFVIGFKKEGLEREMYDYDGSKLS